MYYPPRILHLLQLHIVLFHILLDFMDDFAESNTKIIIKNLAYIFIIIINLNLQLLKYREPNEHVDGWNKSAVKLLYILDISQKVFRSRFHHLLFLALSFSIWIEFNLLSLFIFHILYFFKVSCLLLCIFLWILIFNHFILFLSFVYSIKKSRIFVILSTILRLGHRLYQC